MSTDVAGSARRRTVSARRRPHAVVAIPHVRRTPVRRALRSPDLADGPRRRVPWGTTGSGTGLPQYFWKVIDGELIWGPLITGLGVTIELSIYSMILTVLIGLVTAFLRQSDSVSGEILAKVYLEGIRKHAAAGADAGVLLRHLAHHRHRPVSGPASCASASSRDPSRPRSSAPASNRCRAASGRPPPPSVCRAGTSTATWSCRRRCR